MTDSIETLHVKLDEMFDFLTEHKHLLNCHMVEFITEDHFDKLVPDFLKRELLSLDDHLLCLLPRSDPQDFSVEKFPKLNTFLNCLQSKTLDFLTDHKFSALITEFYGECETVKLDNLKINSFMGVKKSHEVEKMASVVNYLARDENDLQVTINNLILVVN